MGTAKRKQKEIWKSPPSLNRPWVEVSNLGRVRTLDHIEECFIEGKMVKRKREGKIREICCDTKGRPEIQFHFFPQGSDKKENKGYLIHRLVAECFVKNPYPKDYKYVYNKDGDPTNCKAENLVWGNRENKSKRQTYGL